MNMAPSVVAQLAEKMRRPEGTLAFRWQSAAPIQPGGEPTRIVQVVAGRHVFRVDLSTDLVLDFRHASPGTGTRCATLSVEHLAGTTGLQLFLVWSPADLRLTVGSLPPRGDLRSATGRESSVELVVAPDSGHVWEIGSEGVQVGGFTVYSGNRAIVEPSAIWTWRETLRAIDVLANARSDQGFLYEVVQANTMVVMLVTGFEAYTEQRFREVAGEGIQPDMAQLARAFPKIAKGVPDEQLERGDEQAVVPFTSRGINFQNYEQCKTAYRRAYGISFAALPGVDAHLVGRIREALRLRHRAIHVSPIQGLRNPDRLDREQPTFVNREFADGAVREFGTFVSALHTATLELRPSDAT